MAARRPDRGHEKIALALCAALFASLAPAQPGDEAAQDEAAQQAVARKIVTQGEVCPDPQKPCTGVERFKLNELSFRIASKFDFDRGQDRSIAFYAAILKSGELCRIPDEERIAAQGRFPGRKVFLHRYFCEAFGDKVTYTNVNRKAGFVAVYAGQTEAEAKAFLADARANYPDANLRRMQVVITYQLE
jgi:hypothetical protein